MKTLEKIKTTKGAYSLILKVVDDNGKTRMTASIEDPEQSMHIMLDDEDMRSIKLLIDDNLP